MRSKNAKVPLIFFWNCSNIVFIGSFFLLLGLIAAVGCGMEYYNFPVEEKNNTKFKFESDFEIRNIKFSYDSNSRLSINNDILFGVQIGVECGYDEGLKKVNKKLTIKQLYEGMEILKAQGIVDKCMLSFIIGFPWETKHEIDKTLSTMENISTKYGVFCNLNWLIYLPSKLWDERYESNIYVDENIFDDPLWLTNPEIFFKVHPNIDLETVKHVDATCLKLKENKVNIEYNVPFFIYSIITKVYVYKFYKIK